jgi:mono/diheme cytochrome c family protein
MHRRFRLIAGLSVVAGLCWGRTGLNNARSQTQVGGMPGLQAIPGADAGAENLLRVAQKSSKKAKGKMKGGQPAEGAMANPANADSAAGSDQAVSFSRDIAPILVGNCIGCHNPERRRGKFDLTTFQKLRMGSANGPVIVPGKPAESPLVQRIKGDIEPKMPLNNRDLSPESIAKIEAWVKAGARLDPKFDPMALLKAIAPSEEDRRRAELAKLTPAEREQKLESAARDRWKKATPKTTPAMTSGEKFVLFGNLPKDRAAQTLKVLDAQAVALNKLLGPSPSGSRVNPAEKISLYVFNDASTYVEFVRSVESREVEQGAQAHGNLTVEGPYLAAVDPLAGREDDSPKKKVGRSKRGEDGGGAERTLAGLLTEQLGAAETAQAGKPPRWLSLGLGAWLASTVEPKSPYYRRLRSLTADEYTLGWATKAQETLGDEGEVSKIRALGFSLVEWLAATDRSRMVGFIRGMLDDPRRLDDEIRRIWGPLTTREAFLLEWGSFVSAHYGRGR